MLVAELDWPQATVYVALILGTAVVLSVLIWSIFRTGQTAIRSESRKHDPRRETADPKSLEPAGR